MLHGFVHLRQLSMVLQMAAVATTNNVHVAAAAICNTMLMQAVSTP